MNNERLAQDLDTTTPPGLSKENLERELAEMTKVLEAVRFLKDNKHWLMFWGKVIQPASQSTFLKLRREKNDHTRDYLQGMLDAFDRGYDLPGLEKKYSQLVQALSARLAALNK